MEFVQQASSKLRSFLESPPEYLLYPLAAYGLYRTLCTVLTPIAGFWRYKLRGLPNLLSKYGKGSYVLITGASSGVGRALAYQFAKVGFNLILVARREHVLEEVKKEIEGKYKVEVVVVGFDLSAGASYAQLGSGLVERVKGYDISILVNNAGVGQATPLIATSTEKVENIINVNLVAPTILTHLMIQRLAARSPRSAVVNISSGLGQTPVMCSTVYASTKAYLRFLSYAAGEEMKEKVDFLTVNLGRTKTPMINNKKDFFTVEPDEAAFGIVRDIGQYRETDATFRQYFGYFLLSFFPFSWRISIVGMGNAKLFRG